jgi:hypothetical protein
VHRLNAAAGTVAAAQADRAPEYVDGLADTLHALLSQCATQTLGTRELVQGVTKRWLSQAALASIRKRWAAHRSLKQALGTPGEAAAEATWRACHNAARAAVCADKRDDRKRLALEADKAFGSEPNPKRAHELLRRYQGSSRLQQDITVLRHPELAKSTATLLASEPA